jgi:hypothetical protein
MDYSPLFPFGADLFGTGVGSYPSEADLKFLYGLATGDATAAQAKCRGRVGLCEGLANEN